MEAKSQDVDRAPSKAIFMKAKPVVKAKKIGPASNEDDRVNEEWEALKNMKKQGEVRVSRNPVARDILNGFKICHMNMRDGETGKLLWKSDDFGPDMFESEKSAHIPSEILECNAVSREITFSSYEEIEKFRIVQRVFYQGICMEEWYFAFGFVIPGSTNTWQQNIFAAEKSQMLPAALLSGQVTIETSFYDGDLFISKSLMRIYYDGKVPGLQLPGR